MSAPLAAVAHHGGRRRRGVDPDQSPAIPHPVGHARVLGGPRGARDDLRGRAGGFFAGGAVNVLTFDRVGAFDLAAAAASLTALAKGLLARQTSSSATTPANPSTLPTHIYRTAIAA